MHEHFHLGISGCFSPFSLLFCWRDTNAAQLPPFLPAYAGCFNARILTSVPYFICHGVHAHFSSSHSAVLKDCSPAKPPGWTSSMVGLVYITEHSCRGALSCYCLWDYLLGPYLVKNSNKSPEQPHLILVSRIPRGFIPIWLRLSSWNIFIRLPSEWNWTDQWLK